MLELDCIFQLGLYGAEYPAGKLQLTTSNVGGAAGLYSSHHILKMGRHFSEYVENPVDRYFIETQEIYSPSPMPLLRTTKQHAPDITGAIGESLGAIACRQILGLPSCCIEPLKVFRNTKTPDFRIQWNPASLLLNLGHTSQSSPPVYWPLESKMRKLGSKGAGTVFKATMTEALAQLATYWFYRTSYEPSCLGQGLISYYQKESTELRIQVLQPADQPALRKIRDHYFNTGNVKGFVDRFKAGKGNYELDRLIVDARES